ncbi:MAG TPA: GFA family protein [Oligoflexus sp.]|uniref:GFA family protein n=1 Tax=Oligoflexus sp. TaxID=1971216 RepID=UPI002D80FA31|nr:GFA family protein [Oligoflexus sp.]HET9239835.1 GFA family protein [Oligoflexus sp.]
MDNNEYVGHCFCGTIELRVTGSPVAMGYCHCESCRAWSASPVNAFTLWSPQAVRLTQGSDQLASYNKTDRSTRKWCKVCGGHVLTEHPGLGLTDVYAAVIPRFPFKPEVHVNYGETVLHMHDGLSKLMDMPKEMGGSGRMMAD